MLPALIAAAVIAQSAAAPARAASPAPAGVVAPAASASAPDPSPPPAQATLAAPAPAQATLAAPTPEGLQSLQTAFAESCAVRTYGMYDDMCSDLSDQIRRYRSALARAERRRPAAPR